MEALEANPKYRCCCGEIHVVAGTQIICILLLFNIVLFVLFNFPHNIAPAAIIAALVIATLFGTFFENRYLIIPVYWILKLAICGAIFKLIATICQFFIHGDKIIILDVVITVFLLCLFTWFSVILKSCFDYFKWLKMHTNFVPLEAVAHYFQNVMPKMPEMQQIVSEEKEDDGDSDESVAKSSDKTESDSTASMTSVECQTETIET